jgi:hypothetical protein
MMRSRRLRAVLLAASAALLLTSCTGPAVADSSADQPPSPTVEAITTAPATSAPPAEHAASTVAVDPALYAAEEIGSGVVFVSPSRNLRCGIIHWHEQATWGCSIVEKDWEFPSDDPTDYCYGSQVPCGGGIEAYGDGEPHPRQRGDVAFESEYRTDAPVLEYGTSITDYDVTCVSEERGITCRNARTDHGFTISKSLNEIW